MTTAATRAAPWTALPCGGSSPTSQAKRIDIVVVYKVDRLTRSLADFAKIVEVFDASGVSFVSVTQAFNTTTLMGRLTLNVLLSFAQFEREVTGERIRDKIAASKKKGLWMGGFVPFGYRAKDRTLTIDKDEAETVRLIYSRYLELGTVSALEAELAERNIRTRAFTSASNKTWGDRPFSRGHLYKILSNPIYAGKIVHNDKQHDGQHEAIIDRKTFAAVQAQLAANNRQHRTRVRAKEPNLLAGLLFDANGKPLTSSHAVKNGKRYRYYVGTRTEQGKPKPWRLPAHEIESVVLKSAQNFLGDRQRVATALKRSRLQARKLKDALEIASDLSAQTQRNPVPSRNRTQADQADRCLRFPACHRGKARSADVRRCESPPDGNPPPHHTNRPGSAERRRNRDRKRIRSQRQGRSCTRQSAGARLCLVRRDGDRWR